jgi:hypothetical protein
MDEAGQKGTGSRNSDGNVPNVNWNDGKMNVNWTNPDNRNENLRSRQKFQKESPLARAFSQIFHPTVGHFGNFNQIKF